jgi:PAS domain S-box-containing protein
MIVRHRRAITLGVAGLLFAAVFLVRVEVENPNDLVTLFYALPIALVAVELGLGWGLAVAALALGLYGVWDEIWAPGNGSDALEYGTRAASFFVLGGAVGALADRLRSVSEESERLWDLSTDLLCTAGFDGYFRRLNPAWERTLGWTLGELRSQPFIDFVHPDDRERTESEAASLTAVGYETRNFENRYRCKDGSYRTILWAATAIPEEGLIYAIARDGTESKLAQEELRDSERFLDSVLENLPNMVFVKDAEELRFVRFNRAGEELLGCSRGDLIGKNDYDLFSEQEADWFVQKDREVLASDEIVDIPEEPIETAGRGSRVLHTRKIAIGDERGEPRYLLGISEDITDRKLAEQAAEAARAEAERANQAKSEFLSRMSHELRTPLNAVIGFGQLLELDELDPGQRESVAQILKGGRHLLGLINEVLDISRIESGNMSLSVEPVHLGSVLAEALSLMRPLADEAEVRLSGDPNSPADLHVLADQQRLMQVLINVLSNAVKYNRRDGQISVRCRDLAAGRVEVAVADTGRGIAAEQLERLFRPFDRLGAERTEVEGTGLGLSLSLGLMEAMGGTIKAESEPGAGTTVRVQLAAAEAPKHDAEACSVASAATDGPSREPQTVLYIEDNVSNLKLVDGILERLPEVRLISAMHGKLGIELARQHRPDLILLDLHLPDLHGREVLDQLKRDPATAVIPVVVLSADATSTQVERLCAAGAADCTTKPIDVEWLLDTVTGHRPLRNGTDTSHPLPPDQTHEVGRSGPASSMI